MKKFFVLSVFMTLAVFALNAQNLVIKIPKSFTGVKNEKIWLIPVGQTSTGGDVVQSMVTPTEDPTHYIYTMTSASNINKVNNFLNAGPNNRYRVYYHSFNVASVTNTSQAEIGNFKKNCKVSYFINIAAVGQNCQ